MERVSENSFVAVSSYPNSGVESGGELEIAKHWLEKRIEEEILKGAKLREVKLHKLQSEKSSNTGSSKGFKLAKDNNRIPSNSAKNMERKRARSISPLQKKSHLHEARSTSGARSGRPICSMRISELATPTKRQVIDTWRNKAAVLPEFMEATRNNAMKTGRGRGRDCNKNEFDVYQGLGLDEKHQDKPKLGCRSTQVGNNCTRKKNHYFKRESYDIKTGEIEDLVNKKEKLTVELLQKESKLKALQIINMERDNYLKELQCLELELRPPRKINKEGMMRRTMTENQCLSTIFGHKIAQKLITPMCIKLDNPYYKNISTIVADDIYTLVKDRRSLSTDDTTHARMVHEVAYKVTVWIASILDDTSEKLLEEDLKVKKMRDRTSVNDAELITLIGRMACKETELEEQEGPVLDLLDDLVDNVVDSFKRESESSFSHLSSYEVAQKDNGKDKMETFTPDYISAASRSDEDTELTLQKETEALPMPGSLDNIFEEIKESKSDYTLNTYFKDEINEIIASHAFGAQSLDEERSKSGLSAKTASSQPDDNNTISKDQTPSVIDSFTSISLQKSKQAKNLETDDNIDPEITENQENTNVSVALEILDEEYEERNKKVQFSQADLGALMEMDHIGSISRKQEPNSLSNEDLPVHTVKEISYAAPNEHVLSDADDLWPVNISPFAIKPSASVSKSITSMGRILESDEKNIHTPEEEQPRDLLTQPQKSVELQDIEIKDLISDAPQPQDRQSQDLLPQPRKSVELQDLEIKEDLISEAPQPLERQSQDLLPRPQESVKLQDIDIKEDLIPQASQPLERQSQDQLTQPQESVKLQDIIIKEEIIPEAPQPLERQSQDLLPQPQENVKLQDIDIKEDLIRQASPPLKRQSQDLLTQPQESVKLQDIEIKEEIIPEAPQPLERQSQNLLPQPQENVKLQDIDIKEDLIRQASPPLKRQSQDLLTQPQESVKLQDIEIKEDLIPEAPQLLESTDFYKSNESDALEEFQEILGKNDGDHDLNDVMDDLVSIYQERDKKSIGSSEYLDFDFDLVKKNESTLKPDIHEKKGSSQESFASLVVGELKNGDVLQGIITDRGQAKTDSMLVVHSPQVERSKSVENIKRSPTSSKTHQRHLGADVRQINKFDYRVHQKTAPAWIRRGQGEPSGGFHKRCSCQTDVPKYVGVKTLCTKWRCPDPPGAKTMQQREHEIRKLCKDLDNIILNLSKWKNWLDYITGYINNLKQKTEYNKLIKPNGKMHPTASSSNWSKSANKDVWTKLNQRAKGGLKLYKLDDFDDTIKFKISRSPVPAKYCVKCGKRRAKRLSRSPIRK